MNETVSMELWYDDLLVAIDGREETAPVNRHQRNWMIESVLQWCSDEGTLQDARSDVSGIDHGLPLIIPGKKYHISLSSFNFHILQCGVRLIIDDLLANPQNWAVIAAKIGYDLILGFLNNLKRIEPDDTIVLDAISSIKKKQYRGMKKGPSLDEIKGFLLSEAEASEQSKRVLSEAEIEEVCENLVEKKILKVYDHRYSIVF